MSKKYLFLIFTTAIISGISIFFNSFAVQLADPTQYTFARNLFVVLIIFSLLLFAGVKNQFSKLTKRQWLYLILVGLIGGSIAFILFFEGLAQTSGAAGSFIHKTLFVWVAFLAPLFLREKVKEIFFIPAVALLFGNFLLLKVNFNDLTWAHLLILSAAFLWSIENILSKHLLNRQISPLTIIWSRMTFGAAFIFIYLLITSNLPLITDFSPSILIWIVISGLMLCGYMLTWYYGLSRVPVTLASTILLLGSPITTLLSVIFKGQILIPEQILGIVIIIVGIIFALYLFKDIVKGFKTQSLKIRNWKLIKN